MLCQLKILQVVAVDVIFGSQHNGAWAEKISKKMRTTMTRAYENYKRSGNQDAENKYAEFMKFTTNISDVYAYGFVLIP